MIFDGYLDVVIHLGFAESHGEPAVLVCPNVAIGRHGSGLRLERTNQTILEEVVVNVRKKSGFGFLVNDHDYNSVYFAAEPRAFSTGYFFVFNSNLRKMISAGSTFSS